MIVRVTQVTAMKYLKINTLSKGVWYDRDTVLLHAAFQVLVDFIEKEKLAQERFRSEKLGQAEFPELEENQLSWSEIRQLYRWWKEERPRRPNPLDGVPMPPEEYFMPPENGVVLDPEADLEKYPEFYAALFKKQALESEWYEEDQKNLERLIAVRSALWI
jgi:hypothetical protein